MHAMKHIRDGIYIFHKGKHVHIAEQNGPGRVLQYLMENSGRPVSQAELVQKAWKIEKPTEHQLHNAETAVSILRTALGKKYFPPYNDRSGYLFQAELVANDQLFVFEKPTWPELRIFPTPVKMHPRGHLLSRVGWGKNDHVETVAYQSSTDPGGVNLLPYDPEDWSLRIDFKHKRKKLSNEEDKRESWWYARIGCGSITYDKWTPVDLTNYRVLRFEARAEASKPIPFKVRLKDNAHSSKARDKRQSTGWSQEFVLTNTYGDRSMDVDLDDLGWGENAWEENTDNVNRAAVHHLLISQDFQAGDLSGVIHLRNIRFAAAGVENY